MVMVAVVMIKYGAGIRPQHYNVICNEYVGQIYLPAFSLPHAPHSICDGTPLNTTLLLIRCVFFATQAVQEIAW